LASKQHLGNSTRRMLNECIGLIWSDGVNPAESMGLFLLLFLLFPEHKASCSLTHDQRIGAGHSILTVKREPPHARMIEPRYCGDGVQPLQNRIRDCVYARRRRRLTILNGAGVQTSTRFAREDCT